MNHNALLVGFLTVFGLIMILITCAHREIKEPPATYEECREVLRQCNADINELMNLSMKQKVTVDKLRRLCK